MTVADLDCCWLTTLRTDGPPHTTPVWFVLDEGAGTDGGDTIWIASSWSGAKVRNLQRDPRVSVAVDGTGGSPAVAEGEVRLHDLGGDGRARHREVLERFATKYDGWDAADPSMYGPRVMIEVVVRRWLLGP